jgi:hypothetical protein
MPLLAFLLVIGVLLQLPMQIAAPTALGALLMGSVPGRHDVEHLHLLLQGQPGAQRHDDDELDALGAADDAARALHLRHPLHARGLRAADPDATSSRRSP